MKNREGRRRSTLLSTMLVFFGAQFAVAGDLETEVSFDIAPQSLDSALLEFSAQADIQLIVAANSLEGIETEGVSGHVPAKTALNTLLEDTGLKFDTVGSTVTVKRAPEEMSPGKPQPALVQPMMAQNETPATVRQTERMLTETSVDAERSETPFEEIVVTGTNIRGITSPTSSVIILDRATIERSGYSSAQQLIESLPQNFGGGGASEDSMIGPGQEGILNTEDASSINLRGLGVSSTLTLINGRRVAPSNNGRSVDISVIPLDAIERVEVLTDGASAIYGADAVAGVVNFILRRDYDGIEGRVRFGSTGDGAAEEVQASVSSGLSWDSGGALLSLQYRQRNALSAADRPVSQSALEPTDLIPATDEYTALLSTQHRFSDRWDAFGDLLYSRKDSDRAFTNPSRSVLSFNTSEQINVNAGFGYELGGDWRFETVTTYSKLRSEDPIVRTPPLPGLPNGSPRSRRESDLVSLDVKVDGGLFELSGGTVRAALGASYREQRFSATSTFTGNRSEVEDEVRSVSGEVFVPVIGAANAARGIAELSLSAAVRHDRYAMFGSQTNPRFGVLWRPTEDLGLRGSYSTSFRTPNASEQIFDNGTFILNFLFASPGGGETPIFLLSGSEPLVPESSENLSLGVDYEPSWVDGLKVSLNYYRIEFEDRIIAPPFDTGALLRPDVYGSLITPLADDAAALGLLNTELARGSIFFDTLGTGIAGIRHAYSLRQQNAAFVEQDGVDFNVMHSLEFSSGRLDTQLNLAWIDSILTAFSDSSMPADLVDTYGNPVDFRVRGSLIWSNEAWSITGALNYVDDYTDISVFPVAPIDSWTTADFNVRYSPPGLPGFSAAFSVLNAFDEEPPLVGGQGLFGIRYDTTNADPLGRFLALELRQKW